MNGHERRTKETREKLLVAASTVFLEQGFQGASLSRIAKVAGVSQSLIGHHFGGKQGLWDAAVERLSSRYVDRQVDELLQGEGRQLDLLTEAVEAYFRYLQGNPDAVRLNSWLFLSGGAPPPERLRQLILLGFERLRQAQERGLLRDDLPAELVWATFICLSEGWFRLRAGYSDLLQPAVEDRDLDEAFLETMTSIFLNGVKPTTP